MRRLFLSLVLLGSFLQVSASPAHPEALIIVTGDQHSAYERTAQLVGLVDRLKAEHPGVPVAILLDGDTQEYGNVIAQRTGGAIDFAMANPLPGAIKYGVPLVFGALAGCMCERAGVINIAIEGQFLVGAFTAAVVASWAGAAEWGLIGGIAAGVAWAALLAAFAMRYHVNQVVLGVVLIALATGLTDFLLSQIPDDPTIRDKFNNPSTLVPLPQSDIPILPTIAQKLSEIPLLGPTLFRQTLLAYIMYLAIIVVAVLLFQTRWGLRVRSVGEHPKAADTVGLKVNRLRWQAVLFGGVLAGLGGARGVVAARSEEDRGQHRESGNDDEGAAAHAT